MPKQIVPLSDTQVKNAKPQEKDITLFDGGGLYLLIGRQKYDGKGRALPVSKLWRLKYRHAGKEKLLSLGIYPAVSLSDARQRREEAKKLLANGIDPGEAKKEQKATKIAETENSFEVVAREWHERFRSQWTENHAARLLTRLEQDAFPFVGARPIGDIKAPEMLAVLRRIEPRTLETAHRVRIACGQIFRYAVATGRADRDPIADLRGALPPVKKSHFAAPTDPKDLAPLLRAIDGFDGSFVVKCALQFAPLVFVRPGELRQAEWAEIDFEAEQWCIPAEKMKMREPHIVPLSRQAIAILKELQPLTAHSRYVFPCHRSPLRCMSENAVNAALRRMGFEKSEVCGHSFRAVARTLLDEVLQVRPDFIEHQLAHAVKDVHGRAYNRTSHLAERRVMMNTWGDYLDRLKAGAKVLPFKKVVEE